MEGGNRAIIPLLHMWLLQLLPEITLVPWDGEIRAMDPCSQGGGSHYSLESLSLPENSAIITLLPRWWLPLLCEVTLVPWELSLLPVVTLVP